MTRDDWKRVKSIAGEAWDRPAGERAAYITAACAGDDELAREVRSLVAAMIGGAGRFEDPPPLPPDAVAALTDLTGRRLAAYEILSRVGAGGMGEIYKARDTRLNRIVAIKVLPPGASTDAASRDRIEREASAVAALNHPNICTLHDIGRDHGLDFLVMEYLEGESLAARLARGALPVEEALHYAGQIATALLTAHAAGIVHRDVKPANIMLERAAARPSEPATVKLLDFGIAKALRADTGAVPGASGPADQTSPDLVSGTVAYMAPEQVDGAPADARTDVFAFGAVMFEMLTGRKAFDAADGVKMVEAIRGRDAPRLSSVRPDLPAPLDRLVAKCLARGPDDRYQSIADVIGDLQIVQRRLASSTRARIPVGVAVLTLLIGGAAAWVVMTGPRSAASDATSVVRLAASAGVLGAAALSPDGSRVAFSWAGEGVGNTELVVLPIGSQVREVLTHDPGQEEWPAWSPDGRRIAFIRCGAGKCGIYALPASGGPEQKLRDLTADRYFGLAWSPDGRFLAFAERPSPARPFAVFLLSTESLATRRLTAPAAGNMGDLRFAFSPDGRTLGVVRLTETIAVHLIAVDTGADRTLLSGQQEWFGGVAWSADARHLILSANQQGVRRLWRLPIAGGGLEEIAAAGEDSYYPSVSGAAGRLAFVHEFRDWDLWRSTLDGGQLRGALPFSSSARADLDPAFSPDGSRVAFVSERAGTRDLWISNSDGTAARRLATIAPYAAGRPCWSPDGTRLAFHGRGIQVIRAAGGTPRRITEEGETPSWSADGQWIYYIATRDARFHGWKVRAEGGTPVRVLQNEASAVHEGPKGEVYFATSRGGIWRARRGGDGEEPVIAEFDWSLGGYWSVQEDGIYYVVRETLADGSIANRLRFFDFARARSSDSGTLDGTLELWVGGLTVSPDRRTIVYSKLAYQASEVIVLDHFR